MNHLRDADGEQQDGQEHGLQDWMLLESPAACVAWLVRWSWRYSS